MECVFVAADSSVFGICSIYLLQSSNQRHGSVAQIERLEEWSQDAPVLSWSGFSGQPPSLTSEAATAPDRGGLPPKSNRSTPSPEYKERDAMEVISARTTILEIAADHATHPI